MGERKSRGPRLSFRPLTSERWDDLEALFGARGACGGCWCMWWLLPRSVWTAQKGARNKAAFRKLVASGVVPGILAYAGQEPVGWCAVQPREAYPGLARSRVLRRVDDKPVWSIVCLFVTRAHRRRGVSTGLLRAAAEFVRKRGGAIVEGYPVEPKTDRAPDAFVWTGLPAAFLDAGFKECARRSPSRPVMRREL